MRHPLRDGSVILAIPEDHTREELGRLFGDSGWEMHACRGIDELRQMLKPGWSGVIVTSESFRDATWRQILAMASRTCPRAQVIVVGMLADRNLWADVLNHGAFDLIAPPFSTEAVRVATSAWERSQQRVRYATA